LDVLWLLKGINKRHYPKSPAAMADSMSHGAHHGRHTGGTGQKLANGLVIVAGVASLVATLISIV
jgi:hypothetical protein